MDILGYSDLVVAGEAQQDEVLESLYAALSEGRRSLDDHQELDPTSLSKKTYELKAFTDNIVIGWPIHDDAEGEFGLACMKLALFQLTMVLRGFFIRGGLSIGRVYIDEIAVFGDGLTQAYVAESTLARDPRIVVTKTVVEAVKQHLTYYRHIDDAPHVRDLLCDSDGQWFVNYLDCLLEPDYGPNFRLLLKHKQIVESKLEQFKLQPRLFSKYVWVANYHNAFCHLHRSDLSSATYQINPKLFQAAPHLITD